MLDYDYIIVGAGLAGLHCALSLSTKYPRARIAIAEEYNYIGGRVVTYRPKEFSNVQWENGAGRIHESHTLVGKYVKRYGLTPVPMGEQESPWTSLSQLIVSALSTVDPQVLATHTIKEILGPDPENARILDQFEYRSELETLRADLALSALKNEMGSMKGFYGLAEGIGAIPAAMRKELEGRVEFLMRHRLVAVRTGSATFSVISPRRKLTLTAKKIILAIHSEALKKIQIEHANYHALNYLRMEPLLRTYAIFDSGPKGPWFAGIPKTVVDSPIRFVIPINSEKGTIMTSYTDGRDAKYWFKFLEKGEKVLEREIMKELRRAFPEARIPDPIFFKAHPWYDGCTYWLPGDYSPEEVSKKIMNPARNVFVCGESYSVGKQCWIEGALENAEKMLEMC
jgi:monoamine oxidase